MTWLQRLLDAKHNKSQGCYQWLWSGIPSFSGSLIASEKWAKKETHSYWQWCSQLNSNASYLSHFVLWQQKKLFDLFPDMSTTQRMPSTVDHLLKNNSKYFEQERSQNGGSKVIMPEIDCVIPCKGAILSICQHRWVAFLVHYCNTIKLPENEGTPDHICLMIAKPKCFLQTIKVLQLAFLCLA